MPDYGYLACVVLLISLFPYPTYFSCRGNRNCSEWLDDRCKIAVGEILETDLLNSSKRENSDKHEKDGSVNNPTASSSDKDMGHNCCTNQVGKTRQTQSGPLVPASVLNHSSERERNAERFILSFFLSLTRVY